jgi:DNA helicase-2/ATP-dependent DNA helicase PcrA
MILKVVTKFQEDDELLAEYQEKYQYILVDEYQDTNNSQNEVIRLLGSFWADPNIFVVGDDDQSIFRFQGASVENLLDFYNRHLAKLKIVTLTDNYRSQH